MYLQKQTHILYTRFLAFLGGMLSTATAFATSSDMIVRPQVTILEQLTPTGGATTLPASATASTGLPIFAYFLASRNFIFGLAIGFCVLWVLIGGIFIMVSGDNQANREKGIGMMKSAIMGLIILIFAGTILRALNSIFFT